MNGRKLFYDSKKNEVNFQPAPDSKLTLLRTGSIIKQKWMTEKQKDEIDNSIAIDWIIKQMLYTYPLSFSSKLTYPAKCIGDKVYVIKAGTASGKSTVIPVHIYKEFWDVHHKNIVITQPRVITTINTPVDIAKFNLDIELNKNISYTTGSQTSEKVKGIQFFVIDSFLMKLINLTDEQIMQMYSHILIDEVHERSITTDLTLYTLKLFLERNFQNDQCPNILLLSATMDPKPLMDYFEIPSKHYFEVQGKSFPIQETYQDISSDPIKKSVELVKEISASDEPGNILIFIPSNSSIDQIKSKLTQVPDILPLSVSRRDTQYQTKDYKQLFKPTQIRKVMIATNAAETGVTLPDVNFVIDTGTANKVIYNPDMGLKTFNTTMITLDAQQQRKGRTGRRQPGKFFATYTKQQQTEMKPRYYPSIITEDITQLMLKILMKITNAKIKDTPKNKTDTIQIKDKTYYITQDSKFSLTKLDFLTNPSISAITAALEKLTSFNFITQSHELTYQGYIAGNLPLLSPESIRMILSSYYNDLNTQDAIILAAIASKSKKDLLTPEFQAIPINKNKTYSQFYYRTRIADTLIETFIAYLYFKKAMETDYNTLQKFCEDNHMIYTGFIELIQTLNDVTLKLLEFGLNPFYTATQHPLKEIESENAQYIKNIKQTIYDGFKRNVAKDVSDTCVGNYKMIHKPLNVHVKSHLLKPLSDHKLIAQHCPKYLILTEISQMRFSLESTGYVSVLDPYITPDETLFSFI